jgi:hypothetical protein
MIDLINKRLRKSMSRSESGRKAAQARWAAMRGEPSVTMIKQRRPTNVVLHKDKLKKVPVEGLEKVDDTSSFFRQQAKIKSGPYQGREGDVVLEDAQGTVIRLRDGRIVRTRDVEKGPTPDEQRAHWRKSLEELSDEKLIEIATKVLSPDFKDPGSYELKMMVLDEFKRRWLSNIGERGMTDVQSVFDNPVVLGAVEKFVKKALLRLGKGQKTTKVQRVSSGSRSYANDSRVLFSKKSRLNRSSVKKMSR